MDVSRSVSSLRAPLPSLEGNPSTAQAAQGFRVSLLNHEFAILPASSQGGPALSAEMQQVFAQASLPVGEPRLERNPQGPESRIHYKAHLRSTGDRQQLMSVVLHLDGQGMPQGIEAREFNAFAMAEGDMGRELFRVPLQAVQTSARPAAQMIMAGASGSQARSVQTSQKAARREAFRQARDLLNDLREAIENDQEDGGYSVLELKDLAVKPLAVKLAVGVLAIESEMNPGPILRALKLGHSQPEAKVKQAFFEKLPDLTAAITLAKNIDSLNPGQSEVPRLMSLALRLAKESDENFAPYIHRLHGGYVSGEAFVNQDFNPLQLDKSDLRKLTQVWLLRAPALMSGLSHSGKDYRGIEGLLGLDELLYNQSPSIPELLHQVNQHAGEQYGYHPDIQSWLGYTAAHLANMQFSPAEEQQLGPALMHLLPHQMVAHAGSQIIGQAVQRPERRAALCEVLSHFQNKTLGLLLYSAVPDEGELVKGFGRLIPPQLEQQLSDYYPMVKAFAEFAGTDALDRSCKAHLLKLFVEDIKQSNNPVLSCVNMLRVLGTLGAVVNQGNGELFRVYGNWLPKAKNVAQLKGAAKPDERFMLELVKYLIGSDPTAATLLAFHLENPDLSAGAPPPLQAPLPRMAIDRTQAYGWVKSHIRHLTETRSPAQLVEDAQNLMGLLTQRADGEVTVFNFSDGYPDLQAMDKRAHVADNRELRRWTQLAGMLWHDVGAPAQIPKIANEQLQSIADFHSEHFRPAVTLCLYHAVKNPQRAAAFEQFAGQLKAKHTKVFAAPLFLLAGGNPQGTQALGTLIKTVQSRNFRDTRRAIPMLKLLSELALAKSLKPAEMQRILSVVSQNVPQGKDGVSTDMAHVLALVKIADANSGDKGEAMAALKGVHDHGDTVAASKAVAKILYGVPESESEKFHQDYSAYVSRSRSGTALSFFATSLYAEITDPQERPAMLGEIALLAKALVANDDGVTLKNIRYSPQNSPHNAQLQSKAPSAWLHWQEPVQRASSITFTADDLINKVDPGHYLGEKIIEEMHAQDDDFPLFLAVINKKSSVEQALQKLPGHRDSAHKAIERQMLLAITPGLPMAESAEHLRHIPQDIPFPQLAFDIKGLIRKLTAPPMALEKGKLLKASISGTAEDLFLSGTEVIGSCQSIHADAEFAKGLPGYVLDGKYLSAQITNDQGALMSRRMLRLLWSEEHEKPVIYVEKEYGNPGVPDKLKLAVLQLVQEKAKSMNALVAIEGDDNHADADAVTLGTLHALPSGRQFEYVDALDALQDGEGYRVPDAVAMRFIGAVR